MTATTAHGITYPTGSDKIKDLPDHLKQMADSIDTAITANNALPVVVATKTALDAVNATAGRIGIVTNDTSGNNGPYIHNGTGWTRGSVTLGPDVFEFREVTNWRPEYRAWLSAGTVHLSLRLNRKVDMGATAIFSTESVGRILVDKFKPPYYMHLPAFTNQSTTNSPAAAFGIQIQPAGGILVEAWQDNVGINAGGNVQAMLTWPCAFN